MTQRCAEHPDREGATVCERCGDFACAACVASDLPGRCRRCGERSTQLPWEKRPGVGAYFVTVWLLLSRGPRIFRERPAGSVRRAIGFATLSWLLVGATVASALAMQTSGSWVGAPTALVPLVVIGAATTVGPMVLAAVVLGLRRCRVVPAIRASCYLQAWMVLATVAGVPALLTLPLGLDGRPLVALVAAAVAGMGGWAPAVGFHAAFRAVSESCPLSERSRARLAWSAASPPALVAFVATWGAWPMLRSAVRACAGLGYFV